MWYHQLQEGVWSLFDDVQDYWQWGSILLCLLASFIALFLGGKLCKTRLKAYMRFVRLFDRFALVSRPVLVILTLFSSFLWIAWRIRLEFSSQLLSQGTITHPLPSHIIYSAALLVTAIAFYRVVNIVSKGDLFPKLVGLLLLLLFALRLLGWLKPLSDAFRGISLPLGSIQINLWGIFSAILALLVFLWVVGVITRLIDVGLRKNHGMPSSVRVLVSKVIHFALYVAAVLGALQVGGVPLGGLAVFSGALGLGLGFGLQKVIANLISGVIILLDKSIKPGDVIEVEGTFGYINSLRTRYISVITRDAKEILIPNEDFVVNKVVNWSFSDRAVRLRSIIGVSYHTDIPKAMELCCQAAKSVSRVLKNPEPICFLKEFNSSSIDLELCFWINDPSAGVTNVRSDIFLEIWKRFQEEAIEIPFPQQDVHIKSGLTEALQSSLFHPKVSSL